MHFEFKFIMIGDGGVGKRSLVSRFAIKCFTPAVSCIGRSPLVNSFLCIDNKSIKLTIWETAGQERFKSFTPTFFRGAVGALLVYDVTQRETFLHLPAWLEAIRAHSNTATTVMLIGNKSDLDSKRQVCYEEGEQFAKDHGLVFMETSAKTAQNVGEAFLRTANVVYENVQKGVIDPTVVVSKPPICGTQKPQPKKSIGCYTYPPSCA